MITVKQRGNFNNTERFFNRILKEDFLKDLDRYGRKGVYALSAATPVDSGETANLWDYEIHESKGTITLVWVNNNINDGVPIAVILQYGHGTRNGGFVLGRDYINPAIQPVFDEIADSAWKELIR